MSPVKANTIKATVPTFDDCIAVEKGWVAVIGDLVKARLTALVLLTALVGFYLGAEGVVDWALLAHTLVATALLACGAAALNQLIEWRWDASMARTAGRPLPAGRLRPDAVMWGGGVISLIGLAYLVVAVNTITAFLGAVTLASYLFVYTPLKRRTSLNTAIGAIPGALPPLMGWTAVTGELTIEGWALFSILFFWQLPHFLAIGWLHREDYARAGFVMLPVIDPEGKRTGVQTVSHTLGLLSISLFPVLFGMAGKVYLMGAVLLGLLFAGAAIRFARHLTIGSARRLFLVSIIYLPLLLGLMVFDKVS